jgi:hypothetical protein
MIRAVAVLLLITSAFDYCAFDLEDPSAPMSSVRSEAIPDLVPDQQASAKIVTSELPDDRCLCCSPGISPRPPVLFRVTLNSLVFPTCEIAVPSNDPVVFERPPRV